MPDAPFDLTQTDKLLTTTRSVRKRLDLTSPVDLDVVQTCIEIACQAPTGGNSQQWRWLVVDDAAKRAALAELYNRSATPYLATGRQTAAAGMEGILSSAEYLAEHLAEVPVHVVPCILGRPDGLDQMSLAGWYGGILPAVWSLMLALRSRGYGSAWTTLHLPFEKEAAELLGIPPTVTQVALLPVARYTGDDFKPGVRRPAAEITYWNGWKAPRA
jgi:nitroreductase